MKKIQKAFISVLVCLIFITVNKCDVQASQKQLYDSGKKLNQTKKIDITGNGKKDTIKFKTKMQEQSDWIDTFSITINGKKAFTAKNVFAYSYEVHYLRLSSKNIFLQIKSYENNYDSTISAIYKYDKRKKKLVKVLTLESQESEFCTYESGVTHIGDEISVDGKKLKVTYTGQLNVCGYLEWTKTYTYNGKKFVEDKATTKVKGKKSYTPNLKKGQVVLMKKSLKGNKGNNICYMVAGKKCKILKICKCKSSTNTVNGYYILVSQGKTKGWIWGGLDLLFKNISLVG